MKVIIDKEKCIGCGACVGTCPEVFEMSPDGKAAVKDVDASAYQSAVEEARNNCPVQAITIE